MARLFLSWFVYILCLPVSCVSLFGSLSSNIKRGFPYIALVIGNFLIEYAPHTCGDLNGERYIYGSTFLFQWDYNLSSKNKRVCVLSGNGVLVLNQTRI